MCNNALWYFKFRQSIYTPSSDKMQMESNSTCYLSLLKNRYPLGLLNLSKGTNIASSNKKITYWKKPFI